MSGQSFHVVDSAALIMLLPRSCRLRVPLRSYSLSTLVGCPGQGSLRRVRFKICLLFLHSRKLEVPAIRDVTFIQLDGWNGQPSQPVEPENLFSLTVLATHIQHYARYELIAACDVVLTSTVSSGRKPQEY